MAEAASLETIIKAAKAKHPGKTREDFDLFKKEILEKYKTLNDQTVMAKVNTEKTARDNATATVNKDRTLFKDTEGKVAIPAALTDREKQRAEFEAKKAAAIEKQKLLRPVAGEKGGALEAATTEFNTGTKDAGAGDLLNLAPTGSPMWYVQERTKAEISAFDRGEVLPKFPEYFTGARAIIWVNQKKVAAAMDVSWSVSIDTKELRTIDSYMPWELIPGQTKVTATLRQVMHPDRTVTSQGLFTIIGAVLHTPYASIEVRDKLGNPMFFAKGMFTDLEGNVGTGSLGIESVRFMGYYWRQNDQQNFDPGIANQNFGQKLLTMGKAKLGALAGAAAQVGL